VEAVLSWKTTKELISFSQHTNEKYFISFMEKNGLKHGDFEIPSTVNVSEYLHNFKLFFTILISSFISLQITGKTVVVEP
jgi:hypothetical protein